MEVVVEEPGSRRVFRKEERDDKPGQRTHEDFLVPGIPPIGVCKIAVHRRARVEVVAILLAAYTGRAIPVLHDHDRSLPIGALDWRQWTECTAPAASPLKDDAAHQGGEQHCDNETG